MADDPELRKKVTLRQKLWSYGLTQDAYDALLEEAQGRCAVCGVEEPLRIDHNHTTGKVRGLLCHNCNVGLGHFCDDPKLLKKAIDYLKERE